MVFLPGWYGLYLARTLLLRIGIHCPQEDRRCAQVVIRVARGLEPRWGGTPRLDADSLAASSSSWMRSGLEATGGKQQSFPPALVVSGSPGGSRLIDRFAEPDVRLFSLLCCGEKGAPCAGRQPCSGAYIRSDQNGSVGPGNHVLLR